MAAAFFSLAWLARAAAEVLPLRSQKWQKMTAWQGRSPTTLAITQLAGEASSAGTLLAEGGPDRADV